MDGTAPCPDPARPMPAERGVTGVEIAWRGRTPLVGLTRWHCLEEARGATAERRQHWRVIAFVHAGAYELRDTRGRGLVDPMHVAFFRAGQPYTTAHPCGPGDRGSALTLREDLFTDLLRARDPDALDPPSHPGPTSPCPTPVLWRQRRLLREAESAPGLDPLALEEGALEIAGALLATAAAHRRAVGPDPRRSHRDLAEGAKELLGREFRRPLRLEAIALRLRVTPAHLCRVFRSLTGSSIHRYLTGLRLRASLEPLQSGLEDLSGLAFDLGFSSHSHFTHAFRREFGVPPSAWRGASARPRARF